MSVGLYAKESSDSKKRNAILREKKAKKLEEHTDKGIAEEQRSVEYVYPGTFDACFILISLISSARLFPAITRRSLGRTSITTSLSLESPYDYFTISTATLNLGH